MKRAFFVSTAIPYVNAKPHIGHALEYVQADAFVRYRRLVGDDVFFLTGTDDNAIKNVQAAEKAGKPVAEYVAEHAEHFKELGRALNVGYDDFIRTSADPRHRAGVEKLWKATDPSDLYKKRYRGLYCVGCEEFKTEKDLVDGECPEHPGTKLEEVEEENYFFKLSNYQKRLEELVESNTLRIVPESRKNETLAFIRSGLEDFSVSRSALRARGWGIPVPDNPEQYLYVWYDALANYISALDYATEGERYRTYWNSSADKLHMIGKGINRFHTIYWPAMLMSARLPLPSTVFIHGYITSGGKKMSKSLGNVIDPRALIDRYGPDATRYLLLRHVHPVEDSDVTWERLDEWYQSGLANGLGNLVARVMKLAEDNLNAPVGVPVSLQHFAKLQNVDAFEFNRAMDTVWESIQSLDQRIQTEEPFKLVKSDPEKGKAVLTELVAGVHEIGSLLQPFMPETSEKILAAVAANKKPANLFARLA